MSAEVEKVKTFTQADFLGPKNLHEKCVIRDKFNATQSARFATNSILKRLKKCKTQGNRVKQCEIITVTDTCGFQVFLHHPL